MAHGSIADPATLPARHGHSRALQSTITHCKRTSTRKCAVLVLIAPTAALGIGCGCALSRWAVGRRIADLDVVMSASGWRRPASPMPSGACRTPLVASRRMLPAAPERTVLERFGLTSAALDRVLGTALERGAEWADCYFELTAGQTASLEDGLVKKATRNVRQGVGVRVLAGARSGYAYSDEVSLERLELAARTARGIADHGGERGAVAVRPATSGAHDLYSLDGSLLDTPLADQIALLERLDAVARAEDPAITQVMAGIGLEHRVVLVAGPEGLLVGDVRPLLRVSVACIAERGGVRTQGSAGGGGRYAFRELLDGRAEGFARDAARQAVVNLDASPAPAGTMTVVLGPGWPGILLHEAIGHGLEGDFNRKRTSAFTDRIGTRVASELCTVIDDGTIPGRRGSLNVDDEGTPTSRTVLIERGVLRG